MLTVAVLGPLSVRRDGVPVAVPSGKTTEVLIRLALEAGRPVRAAALIEDLWDGAASPNALQAKVSKLRRVLGDPGLVSGDALGYTLHVAPGEVDALRVLADPDAVAGLALFAGDEILPDAGEGAWVQPWRARLADARLRLAELSFAVRLDGAVVGELEALVAAHPLREELWRLLITALYRDGRQGDALATFRRARTVLADELGVDPGPLLRALERQILVQDAALAPGNLPALSSSLIGREGDLTAVAGLLAGSRLVTVVGPAGVGKTRLAVEVARGSGGWLVRLDTAGSVWAAVGEAFAIAEATPAMVLDRLRGLQGLVLLDNCEHLVLALAPVVESILGAAPGVTLLATSQVPLGLDGEITYTLEPLPPDAAATLFRERAGRHRRIAADEDVGGVIRRLDGLPLAIELAAARTKALPVPEIARRLDDRFAVLRDPHGRRPARQRTLHAAIGWSYDLLFPDDQRGLWALSVFAGGAPLPAVEQVLGELSVPRAAALDVLDRLVDRSLAFADIGDGSVRYRLLDSVRAFGAERLTDAGLTSVAASAHAAWYASAAGRAAAGLRGPEQASHLDFARRERANLDAAVTWTLDHDPALGLRIVNGFGWAWIFLGAGAAAAARSRSMLAAADSAPGLAASAPGSAAEDRVDALLFASWFEASGGDLERAFADVAAARAISPLPRTLLFQAFLHSQQGRPAEALVALGEFRPFAAGWELGAAWLLEAWARTALGEVAQAAAACEDALRLLTPLGDAWVLSHAEALLGGLAQAGHAYPAAVDHLARAASGAHRLGFAAAEALHLANLGRAQQQNGMLPEALETLDRAAATAESVGELRGAAFARTRRARVLRALGRLDECRAELGTARGWYETAGGGDGDLLSAQMIAALDDDRPALERVLAAARAAGDHEVELLTLDALARRHAAAGDHLAAGVLAAAADALLPAVGHQVTPADRLDRII
ncbi:putative ATPase/DNA-binding SARP family transcriptional activator [Actinoplanes tereljensis]|uniref:SARP family transcriptional regulator n=1 Tax=Paractinoplanes tereljensis TaxID=571912 RepID=A0A919TW38_9ACTN|nr:BTAD domain-containing putative transcriptional regulator [Actinoplanes tereljensis]GIF22537.1 SARP family transcriptional regulator [Actinoplanes tereljensis]